jgi:hypothetical protein
MWCNLWSRSKAGYNASNDAKARITRVRAAARSGTVKALSLNTHAARNCRWSTCKNATGSLSTNNRARRLNNSYTMHTMHTYTKHTMHHEHHAPTPCTPCTPCTCTYTVHTMHTMHTCSHSRESKTPVVAHTPTGLANMNQSCLSR